jgi:hypothetical protein
MTIPSWLVDTCTYVGAASLTFTAAVIVWCAFKTVQDRRAAKAPVKGWDLEPWVEFPPWAERSCHPDNVDIDCEQCRRWLHARNTPPAGVS